jgi:hypothetical protein
MRPGRLVSAAVLVAVAIALGLFARDVRATQRSFARDDLRVAAAVPGQPDWRASTTFPFAWSDDLLGLGGDRRLRLAIQEFKTTYNRPAGFDSGQAATRARDAAEAALAASAQDADPKRASLALDLLGLLVFGDSTAGGGSAAATRAVSDLQQSIALDAANDAAKTNLELVLKLLRTNGSRVGSAAAAGPRSSGHRGAGSGTPGEGY